MQLLSFCFLSQKQAGKKMEKQLKDLEKKLEMEQKKFEREKKNATELDAELKTVSKVGIFLSLANFCVDLTKDFSC